METIQRLKLSDIKIDGGTQSRAEMSEDAVTEYAEAYARGDEFPSPLVFFDGEHRWLSDGFHRVHALLRLGKSEWTFEVQPGSRADAFFRGAKANAIHGVRRTSKDKRRAVELALGFEPFKSDRWIADMVAVGHPFVAKVRAGFQLESDSSSSQPTETTRLGQDGRARSLPRESVVPPKSPKRPVEIVRPEVSPRADTGEADDEEERDDVDLRLVLSTLGHQVWDVIKEWRSDPDPLLKKLDSLAIAAREHFDRRAI